jgi:hypothetical protein
VTGTKFKERNMSDSREIKRCAVKILSDLTKKKLAGTLDVPPTLRANIFDCNNNMELLAENVVIEFPFNEPTNINYEIGRYYRLDLEQINGEWKFKKYCGSDVEYLFLGKIKKE